MFLEKILAVILSLLIYLLLHKAIKVIANKVTNGPNKISISFGFQVLQAMLAIATFVYICTLFEATKAIYSSILMNMSLIVVVLGFAGQESIKNVLSGIMITNSKLFRIGQRITLEDRQITGIVKDVTLRHTIIQRINNTTVIVPNSVMNNAIIENSSFDNDETIANFLDLQVAYESDIDKAIEIIKQAVSDHPYYIKEKEPSVAVRNLAAEGYDVRAVVWTRTISENFKACSDLRIQIKKEFDKNDIEIPYNHINILQKR